MLNEFFEKYVSYLKRKGSSISKHIKTGEHPKQHHPQYANTQHLRDLAQKSTINTLKYVQNTFPQFSLHTITIKPKQSNKTKLQPFNRRNVLRHSFKCCCQHCSVHLLLLSTMQSTFILALNNELYI